MRLLLDAHVSGSSVGVPLEKQGHDVRALGREPASDGLDDGQVLELAAAEGRILITHDVSDFPHILREWAEAGRRHTGVILIYGIRQQEFGVVVRGILRLLRIRARQSEWVDVVMVLTRSGES